MRKLPLIFIALAAGAAAPGLAADKLGARTASPEQLLAELGLGVSDAELERAVAAASAHPLGTRENPVRVGGPEGERAYIARLRCADGSAPTSARIGSAGVGAFGTIVDLYRVECGDAAPGTVELVMDMYHAEHGEDRAPQGFSIVPR